MARPKKEFDWSKLDAILQYGATMADASDIMGVHHDTLIKRIRAKHKCSFTEYKEQKMAVIRTRLRAKQFEVAMQGNVSMLIWLGKNMLGQTDKVENEQIGKIEIKIDRNDSKL